MSNQDTSLNPEWKKRIKQVGKRAFEVEEMLRLGFLEPSDFNVEGFEKAAQDLDQEKVKKAEKELKKTNKAEMLDMDKEDRNLYGPVTIKNEDGKQEEILK